MKSPLRIAIIGQSNFAVDVLELLLEKHYNIVGVFTIPNKGNREDCLATTARIHNIPIFKIASWRKKGHVIPEVLQQYKSVSANLNVLPYCSQFIPIEVINNANFGSICYHPSLLPRHRGANAISWTLIEGDEVAGFSIFWLDAGLDTGPILLQKYCNVKTTDTLDILYKRFLYPEGVKGILESINLISKGIAPKIKQMNIGATYDPALFKKENQYINLNQSSKRIWNFIRGLDSNPGALAIVLNENGTEEEIRLYDAHLYFDGSIENGCPLKLKGLEKSAYIHQWGLIIQGTDGNFINVKRAKKNGRVINACDWFKQCSNQIKIEKLSQNEIDKCEKLRNIWNSILKCPIESNTDFFESGASSMDVVRLVEECKEIFDVPLENKHVFMSPSFDMFFLEIIKNCEQEILSHNKTYFNGFVLKANNREISIPTQLFINGEFIDAEFCRRLDVINPSNEEIICQVSCASSRDIDLAAKAAYQTFHKSWKLVSAQERSRLMFKLADLMDNYKEDLATIESIDSGAVYTLALKTHIGMSIDAWRYFAGCCDKIQGTTIPVNPARPNKILTFTKKEPLGVIGLIIPWNYPLMMLSWKMAACIAAGNTCIIKPAEATPLTALKFAELSVRAGFPPGVINILSGVGSEAGQALCENSLICKIGFTGSTIVGKTIMRSCALTNLKSCSLELGGKSPLIIFADCNFDKAVKYGISSVFFNKGENCIAAGRLFVEDSIHDDFVRCVLRELRTFTIGDPLKKSTVHGPQNHREHFEKLIEFCQRGINEGATLAYGGKPVPNMKGYYFQPTVFINVEDHMFIAQNESFGPIMIISKFHGSDVESVMRRANNTEYGLACGIFTNDINKALMFADQIDAGTVFVNVYNKTDVAAPFGGFKQSGFGKDLGQEALNEYLRTKCVTIEY